MGSLVHQRGELRVRPAHEQEGQEVRPPAADPHGGDDDAERLHVGADDAERVAARRDAAQVRPQRRHGRPVGRIRPSGAGTVSSSSGGEHRGDGRRRHGDILHFLDRCRHDVMLHADRRRPVRRGSARVARHDPLPRPLTPRSVIASLLLGIHPPRLRGALLVRWCGLLGIAEGTTRVALSRMVDAGELTTRRRPLRAGRPAAGPPGRPGLVAGARACCPGRASGTSGWCDRAPATRASRAALRRAAAAARLVERRDGVWGRPDNLPPEATPPAAREVLTAQAERWSARPDPAAAIDVPTAFSLPGMAERSGRLLDRPRARHRGARRRRPGPAGAGLRPRRRRPPAGPPRSAPAAGAGRVGVARSRSPRRVRRVPGRVRHRGRLVVRRGPNRTDACRRALGATRSAGSDHRRSPPPPPGAFSGTTVRGHRDDGAVPPPGDSPRGPPSRARTTAARTARSQPPKAGSNPAERGRGALGSTESTGLRSTGA